MRATSISGSTPTTRSTTWSFPLPKDGNPQPFSSCESKKREGEAAAVARGPAAPAPAAHPAAPDVPPATRFQISPERPGDLRYRDRRLLGLYFDMSAMPVPD